VDTERKYRERLGRSIVEWRERDEVGDCGNVLKNFMGIKRRSVGMEQ